jgi:hypothetical protein
LCPDSSQQFVHAERFGNVVVGAGIQSLNFGAFLPAHRQDNDWDRGVLPNLPAETYAVKVGHGEIGYDHLWGPILHEFQRHLSVIRHSDVIAL